MNGSRGIEPAASLIHIRPMSDAWERLEDVFRRHFQPHHATIDQIAEDVRHIRTNTERLIQMSSALTTDIAAQNAAVQALVTEVQTGLAANATAIQALKDQIAAGGTVSAADLATLEGNTAAIQKATSDMQAALNPAPAPSPPV